MDINPTFDYKRSTQSKVLPLVSDMPEEMEAEATDVVTSMIEKYTKSEVLEHENATKAIKEQMDKLFGPSWHCVVGEAYSFDVSAQRENLLYIYYTGTLAVLLWKC